MNKRKFVVILLMIFFIISNTFGEDKWQKSKKYSDICLPSDSMIYKIEYRNKVLGHFLYKGKKYYSLYPLLNNIKESDPEISNSLISAYKINQYALSTFNTIGLVSYLSFIGSITLGFCMWVMSGVINSSVKYWFACSCLSLISSVGIGIVYGRRKDKMANDIRDHYNNYISENNKSIGLRLNYQF